VLAPIRTVADLEPCRSKFEVKANQRAPSPVFPYRNRATSGSSLGSGLESADCILR